MWFLLSFLSALGAGTSDALAKQALRGSAVRTVAWVRPGWGALYLLPLAAFAAKPTNPAVFWQSVAFAVPLEVAAALLFQSALRLSPISVCLPFLAFSPVFLLGLGWVLLGERPGGIGAAGVIAVTLGAFLLQTRPGERTPAAFWRSVRREKGPAFMAAVAFLYALTSTFAKKAVVASSPLYFGGVYYGLIALALTPVQWTQPGWGRELVRHPRLFALMGACEASTFLVQFQAFLLTETSFVIAVKRLSLLVSVFYGWAFFGEKGVKARVPGALLMGLGAALIALR